MKNDTAYAYEEHIQSLIPRKMFVCYMFVCTYIPGTRTLPISNPINSNYR